MRWLGHIAALHRCIVVLSMAIVALTVSEVTEQLAVAGAPAGSGGGTSLIGKLKGPRGRHRPSTIPQEL